MARNASSCIVLQATTRYFTFARVGEDGAIVDQALERGDWGDDGAAMQVALKGFVQRHGLNEEPVYAVLPRYDAVLRIMEFPSQSSDELSGMVELSAQDLVPYPAEDVLARYEILESLPEGASRVLVAVARRSVVEERLAMLHAAGVHVAHILLSTSCLVAGLEHAADAGGNAAIAHVSPDAVEVVVARDGVLRFGRCAAVEIPGEPDRLPSIAIEDIANETKSSLNAYARESDEHFDSTRVLISADGFVPDAIVDGLREQGSLDASSVSSANPSLVLSGAARLARRADRIAIDLMPEAETSRRKAASNRSRIVRLAIATGIAIVATLALYIQAVAQRQRYLDELEARAAELRPVASTLRTMRQQLQLIEDQVDRSTSPLGMVATVAKNAPEEGLNIQRVSYDRNDRFLVAGSAIQPSDFEGLIDNLRGPGASDFAAFARARELYRTTRVERGKNVWDFAITVPLVEDAAP